MFNSLILELSDKWTVYRSSRKVSATDRCHKIATKQLPSLLNDWSNNDAKIKCVGSDGDGFVANAPWVAVFHKDVTTSPTDGYYIVYLLSEDLKRLVLEIGFGATQFTNIYGNGKACFNKIDEAVISMRDGSQHLANTVLNETKSRTNSVPVRIAAKNSSYRQKAYEHCAIYSLTYEIESLPNDDELKRDFKEYFELYLRMAQSVVIGDVDDYLIENIEPINTQKDISVEEFKPRPAAKKINSNKNSSSNNYKRYSKKSNKIGRLGEELVFKYEKDYLHSLGFQELATKVILHRDEVSNRTPGWDITSYDESGNIKYIEVKATEGKTLTSILLTRQEWEKAQDPNLSEAFYIYFVTDLFGSPKIEKLRNPAYYVLKNTMNIRPEIFELSLREVVQ